MARKERHVVSNSQGGWDVEKSHAGERASKHCDTNAEAVDRARDICRDQGAECVVHDSDGEIRRSNSYGKDPCPPSDSKGGWIVTRRGYVVPLEKGKEGIHKKFDEILSTSSD
jgi:hypothetical protein